MTTEQFLRLSEVPRNEVLRGYFQAPTCANVEPLFLQTFEYPLQNGTLTFDRFGNSDTAAKVFVGTALDTHHRWFSHGLEEKSIHGIVKNPYLIGYLRNGTVAERNALVLIDEILFAATVWNGRYSITRPVQHYYQSSLRQLWDMVMRSVPSSDGVLPLNVINP